MIRSVEPPPDIDELARRLPGVSLSDARAQRMRRALLDAAAAPAPRRPSGRRIVTAAAAPAALVATAMLAVAGGRALLRSPARDERPSTSPPGGASPAIVPLPDGLSRFDVDRPLQLTRGPATIVAPPGARFDVEVRGDRIERIAVWLGQVTFAPHADAAVRPIIARETWTLAAASAEPAPPPADCAPMAASQLPSSAPASAPSSAPSSAPLPSSSPRPRPSSPPAPPPPAPAVPTAEQDFRDGLQALMSGHALAAVAPLARACGAPSSSQEDVCYWTGVAALRAGDHARARATFTDVLARWPGSTHAGEASVSLGWLLLELGDRTAARARFTAATDDPMPSVRRDAERGLAAARTCTSDHSSLEGTRCND